MYTYLMKNINIFEISTSINSSTLIETTLRVQFLFVGCYIKLLAIVSVINVYNVWLNEKFFLF